MNTLIINCSYRKNGNTSKLCEIERKRFGEDNSKIIFLKDVFACYNCSQKHCEDNLVNCKLKDAQYIFDLQNEMQKHDNIVFVTPVYLNAPTPKILAFLSRLNSRNDLIGRDMFRGKYAYISAIADVSGTQQTISILRSALDLLAFDFRGKSSREHILEWKTGKIRGGYSHEPKYYLERINNDCL